MKLLYAEDEESMAEAVTDILVFHKYQVDTVYDGEEALEYARKEITRTIIMLSEEPQQSVKQQNEPPVQPEGNLEKLFDRFTGLIQHEPRKRWLRNWTFCGKSNCKCSWRKYYSRSDEKSGD